MIRFNTFKELGKLIPVDYGKEYFPVSLEEREVYIDLLRDDLHGRFGRMYAIPTFRGVKLIVNADKP